MSQAKITELQRFVKLLAGDQGKEYSPLESLVRSGNIKIPRTTAIFNMGPATGCPSLKLGLCQALIDTPKGKKLFCYARRSEKSYRPRVLPFRQKQERYWKATTAESFTTHFLILNALKANPFNSIRFNEAGDFWSQECIDKAEQIARYLKPHGVKCYCYTARSDLDYTGCRDLTVMGSGYRKDGMKGEFRMIMRKEDRPKGWMTCEMDCRVCNRCQKGGNIVVVKH